MTKGQSTSKMKAIWLKLPAGLRIFLSFFVSKSFLINVVIAGVLVTVVVWFLMGRLDSYTLHGETQSVPNLIGYHMNELDAECAKYKVRYMITDSVFDDEAGKGTVLVQNPPAGAQVKENRTIYVTVNSVMPKMLSMPNLKDKSSRQAAGILEIIGLRVKNIETKPAQCNGCVLEQLYRGKPIAAGSPIARGKSITLVVGKKGADEKINIPNLANLTIDKAKIRLNESSLNLGSEVYIDCLTKEDSVSAVIYKQSPPATKFGMIPLGSAIDVWLRVPAIDSTAVTTGSTTSDLNE